jgi:phosphatidate cytidylyltransferase
MPDLDPEPDPDPEPDHQDPGSEPGRESARPANRRRAGRDLPAAFAVGGALAAMVLASLLVWRPLFLAVIALAICAATWELGRAVRGTGARPPVPPLLAGGVAMAVAAWFYGPQALSIGLLVTVLAVMVWRLVDGPAGYQRDVSAATLIVVYVPFLGGFAALLGAPDDGHWRVLVMIGVVVLTDTGGYVAGVFFGRHPMAPAVSPSKTWEGLIGSLLAAAAGGALGLAGFFAVDWWWGAGFGLLVAVAAVLGDLTESALKRDLGVKDMSDLLPGHGGVMDRLDSILFAAPAAYLLLSVLAG